MIAYAHCELLSDPDNGDVSHQFPVLGTIARYSCDFDFVLIGEDNRVCSENGSWSGMEPTCEGKKIALCMVAFNAGSYTASKATVAIYNYLTVI